MTHLEHKKEALRDLKCAVVTVSDTRTEETDDSGRIIQEALRNEGHSISMYRIVKDEASQIREAVLESLEISDVVICNGGTGISPRDVTVEALVPLMSRILEGFGEIFRTLSYKEIGSSAMLSRAIAGVVEDNLVFCLPGSPNAVKVAMEELVLPEMGHVLSQVRK
ncbi:MAG: molybdenum cofactor biosynthesis protein MoaB [Methanomassiliicoccales archaeon]|nr:MAG: molybdenum cofactor biosynthesis protein MoaB [Methanomassiliicoccales archaeon]